MYGDSRGGNDTLIGGAGPGGPSSFMFLYGDASEMHDNARGGNDHLTGGTGNSHQRVSMATPALLMATAAAAMTR